MGISLALYDFPGGSLVEDVTQALASASLSTNEHGFADCSFELNMSLADAFALYDRATVYHMVATDSAGVVVWEGRLEDIAITPSGIRGKALGYQRAYSDLVHTALWSDSSTARWRALTGDELPGAFPDRFEIDNNKRLFISPSKDSKQGPNIASGFTTAGYIGYIAPNQGERSIIAVSFDYSALFSLNWTMQLRSYNSAGTLLGAVWSLNSTGIVQTGSVNLTISACTMLAFVIYYTGTEAPHPNESGENYLKVTAPRVKTTASATITAAEVAQAITASVAATNPGQTNPNASSIGNPGIDLKDLTFEDITHAEALTRLCNNGDNASPPRRWRWAVWERRALVFESDTPQALAQYWYVDASELELESTLEALYNASYASYKALNGEGLRTQTATDAASISRWGLTRRRAVSADTTSLTLAAIVRDAGLNATKTAKPRATVRIAAVYDASGTPSPLYQVRAGDVITIRNLSPKLSIALDQVRSFSVTETSYDLFTGELEVVPESPLASLDVLIARGVPKSGPILSTMPTPNPDSPVSAF